MMTKEEIQRSITELQYQYQSLIREGSYKLAKIRKERIKKLREQLKQLNKAKVQDSMDILRLCGYAADASIQVGPWTIYQEGNEISVHRGGRAWAQGFKSVQEAKSWIKQKEHWIETGQDEWPTFTKGTTKDKTKAVGQIGSVKIYYDDNDDMYYVNQGGSIFNNPGFKTKQEAINYVVKNNTKDDDATEHGSIKQYGKGTKTESMGLSENPTLAQDGGPGSGIKGHRTPENEEPKKTKSGSKEENSSTNKSESNGPYKVYSTSSEEEKARIAIANKFPKGTYIKSPGGRILKVTHSDPYENQLFLKVVSGSQKGKEGLFDYKALTEEGITKVDPSEIKSKPAKKNKLKDSKPVKDADPKVAEAQAIINLCGGIF